MNVELMTVLGSCVSRLCVNRHSMDAIQRAGFLADIDQEIHIKMV